MTPSALTYTRRRKPAPVRPADIILAADQADGRAYADRHDHSRAAVIITPRTIPLVRGRVGPVYATRKARQHDRYRDMLTAATPCGLILPRTARDRRVA